MIALVVVDVLVVCVLGAVAFYLGYRKGRYDERGDRYFADIMRRRYGS